MNFLVLFQGPLAGQHGGANIAFVFCAVGVDRHVGTQVSLSLENSLAQQTPERARAVFILHDLLLYNDNVCLLISLVFVIISRVAAFIRVQNQMSPQTLLVFER